MNLEKHVQVLKEAARALATACDGVTHKLKTDGPIDEVQFSDWATDKRTVALMARGDHLNAGWKDALAGLKEAERALAATREAAERDLDTMRIVRDSLMKERDEAQIELAAAKCALEAADQVAHSVLFRDYPVELNAYWTARRAIGPCSVCNPPKVRS